MAPQPPPAPGPREQRLAAYLEGLAQAAGHKDRHQPLISYCLGLLLPGERKSAEPMAARLDPNNIRRAHQSLHHVVAVAPSNDQVLLQAVREYVLPWLSGCRYQRDRSGNLVRSLHLRLYTSALAEILKSDLAEQVKIREMPAGDVLFWNSRLIHGSIAGQDPSRSRLSLTAHYIPDGFGFGKRNKPCTQAFPFQVEKTYPIAFQRPE